jgi:ABC-type uncharacterized transport system permease subunit
LQTTDYLTKIAGSLQGDTSLTATWTCKALALAASTQPPSLPAVFSLSTGALEGDITYTFTLSAVYSEQSSVAMASAWIVRNAAPTSGLLKISPSYGVSIYDKFNFAAQYWVSIVYIYIYIYIYAYTN